MKSELLQSKSIWIKIVLILIGMTMPLWLSVERSGLAAVIERLQAAPSGATLMMAAFGLVMLNTVRALPHYIGALLLGDELGVKLNRPWLKVAVPLIIIPLVYALINGYNSINYHFGGPAIFLLLSIAVLHFLGNGQLRPVFKAFILAQLLFGFQWLDTVLFLSAFGFGGGQISMEVKSMAAELGFGSTLSFYSLVFFAVFIVNATFLAVYLTVAEQKAKMRQDLDIARLDMVESRSGREALHLVHDLKTPLSLMEGLNSLIQMKTKDDEILQYTNKISSSIQATSDMVSEILYHEKKNWCTLKTFIEYVRANKLSDSATIYAFDLSADENIEIYINKIRMTRALVNLIDNASDAVEGKKDAKVTIATKVEQSGILIGVKDNGHGISQSNINKIWNAGYSTKSHPGVGLTFVKNVVNEHGAELSIESEQGVGTTFWIHLPKERVRDENTDYG
ncbi:HAMP domain-containing sensor histidine kinase [Halobacillus sp. HZG1]|uniref:sensor histidine kinase n=1 Tax=Halobacillus sp. HZG1 TaxID=3111769 RepID=UPI002DB816BC|nr:HAMP domain-containing sensor histidine kinase [Halobacillus sp. HZG1]MEC3884472.1 HAMP domain-containing sensor histidine kinase [Halobacillus sp. HZG1]